MMERWRHQQQAFEFVLERWKQGLRGLMLAIVMGGGKSRVTVDLAVASAARQVLILCPLRVVEVWRAQFERFAPGAYHFLALDDRARGVRDKTRQARDLAAWGAERERKAVIAINYDSARKDPFASWALSRPWDLVVLDEAHKIKQATGRTSRWCAQLGLRAHHRLALTGTPMAHQPIDIWAQFRFLDPGFLDPAFSSFRERYAVMGGYFKKEIVGWKNLDQLEAQFRQLAFRVDESVLDLPPEMDQTFPCELGETGAKVYREMEQEMITWIQDQEGQGHEVTAANAMVKLLRLQQITGGSVADSAGCMCQIDRSKQHLLRDVLEDLDEPVVVFARFRADLAAIHWAAADAGKSSGELSGARDDLAAWQGVGLDNGRASVQPDVLAVQMQAGGVGVDLTRARIAIYYSLGFSLAEYLQSRARVRRPPQQRPCLFYHLQVRDSVDESVMRAVQARSDLVDLVLKELRQKGTHASIPARSGPA